ncbi:unnamed protein product, partial [Amoebophrya sp. A25]
GATATIAPRTGTYVRQAAPSLEIPVSCVESVAGRGQPLMPKGRFQWTNKFFLDTHYTSSTRHL